MCLYIDIKKINVFPLKTKTNALGRHQPSPLHQPRPGKDQTGIALRSRGRLQGRHKTGPGVGEGQDPPGSSLEGSARVPEGCGRP